MRESKAIVYAACDRLGLEYWKSDANFVLIRTGDHTEQLVSSSAALGVYLRDRAGEPGCAGCIRMTAGIVEHHAACLQGSGRGPVRRAVIDRRTTETAIALSITLGGRGRYRVSTGIRFLDHMLELVARHGGFDLAVKATGDLDVDQHHTVEDLGIALGEAVSKALGDRRGINRAGYFVMPMDETLAVAAIDLGGRPHTMVDLKGAAARVGDLQTELVQDFFEGFASGARANVHVKVMYADPAITRLKRYSRRSRARCGWHARKTSGLRACYQHEGTVVGRSLQAAAESANVYRPHRLRSRQPPRR